MLQHTIAVIGANGHVGRGVVDWATSQGHRVVALDRSPHAVAVCSPLYTYKQVDALDFAAVKNAISGCTSLVLLSAAYNEHDLDGKIIDDTPQHVIHNANVCMSYNALCASADLGINRVVLASSVNAMGMLFSEQPQYDYFPIDESHPSRPEEAYSVSKYIGELQADSFARRYPHMRIASLRFHWVVPTAQVNKDSLDAAKGSWRDLWGWVSLKAAASSVLASITVPESRFPNGHEAFFIVAKTSCQQKSSRELIESAYPDVTDLRASLEGNESCFDTSKAERLLGWSETGFPWASK